MIAPTALYAGPASVPQTWAETRPRLRFATPRLFDFTCFLLLLSGPPQLRVRDATASLRGEMDGAILLRLAVWGIGFAWLLVRLYPVVIQRGMVPRVSAYQAIGALLLVVLAAGIAIAPGPMLTAFSVYQLAVMLAFSWVFVQLYGPEVYVRYLFWGYAIIAVALLVSWLAMPELVVRRGRLRGDLIGPAGAIGALGLTLCLSGAIRMRKGMLLLVASVFAVVLVASQTRTAFAAFLAAVTVGCLFRYAAPVKKMVPVVIVGLLVAELFGFLSQGARYVIRESQSLATLSDRVPLWGHLLDTMLRDSPAIGLGYYSASRVLGPQYNAGLGNAHSAFIEILVGGGLLGGLLFFSLYGMLLARSARLLVRGRDHPLTFAVLGMFAIVFVISVTNTDGIQSGPVGFTFWSLTALIPALWSQMRARQGFPSRFDHARTDRP